MPDLNSLLPGIRYVVVGGTATSLYMPTRTTKDVDILIAAVDAPTTEEALKRGGAIPLGPLRINNPLRIEGKSWQLPDGSELDVLNSAEPWVEDALTHPNLDDAGLPIVPLPYLVLMKLASGRGIDVADISRMLGAAEEATVQEVREVVRSYLPDAMEDVDSLAALGHLEFEESKQRPDFADDNSAV